MSTQELQVKEDNAIVDEDPRKKLEERLAAGDKVVWDALYQVMTKASGDTITKTIFKQLMQINAANTNIEEDTKDIKAIDPQDQLERMLAAQMITTHNMLMDCFRRAVPFLNTVTPELVSIGHDTLRLADRLTRTYAVQMETLSRYRNKGKQKMTVEHVHVNAGGQAIIGNVETKNKA